MGGDLGALYRDMLEHPEKYEDEDIQLVTRLLYSSDLPSLSEQQRLDMAVYAFNTPTTPKPKPPERPTIKRVAPAPPTPPERPLPISAPSADLGGKDEDIPQAFWWLRGK